MPFFAARKDLEMVAGVQEVSRIHKVIESPKFACLNFFLLKRTSWEFFPKNSVSKICALRLAARTQSERFRFCCFWLHLHQVLERQRLEMHEARLHMQDNGAGGARIDPVDGSAACGL